MLGAGQGPACAWTHEPLPQRCQRALDVDRVGEAAAAVGRLDQVAVSHPCARQPRLVGEEAAVLELDHAEAEAEAGFEGDLRGGAQSERAVELGALQLVVPARPGRGVGVGLLPDLRRGGGAFMDACGLPAAHFWIAAEQRWDFYPL